MKYKIEFDFDISYSQYRAFTKVGDEFICALAKTPEEAEERLIQKLKKAEDIVIPSSKEIEI